MGGQGSGKYKCKIVSRIACFVPVHEVHHSAIRPRAFPLGLLAPRCLCSRRFLAFPPIGRVLGAASRLGEESYPSPSFGLILVPSDSGLAQPPSSFSFVCSLCRFRFLVLVASAYGGAHPWARTPVAETPEAGTSLLCAWPTLTVRAHPRLHSCLLSEWRRRLPRKCGRNGDRRKEE
jgi:hypothetical protein